MRRTSVRCDRCGATAEARTAGPTLELRDAAMAGLWPFGVDLCPGCRGAFVAWLGGVGRDDDDGATAAEAGDGVRGRAEAIRPGEGAARWTS